MENNRDHLENEVHKICDELGDNMVLDILLDRGHVSLQDLLAEIQDTEWDATYKPL